MNASAPATAPALRTPAPRKISWTVLAILAVAAVLLGIVAMHGTMAAGGDVSAASGPVAAHSFGHSDAMTAGGFAGTALGLARGDVTPSAASAADGGACSGMCALECMMLGAVCLLGIAAAVVGLILLARPAVANFTTTASLRTIMITARRLAAPRPPSLFVLSICRT